MASSPSLLRLEWEGSRLAATLPVPGWLQRSLPLEWEGCAAACMTLLWLGSSVLLATSQGIKIDDSDPIRLGTVFLEVGAILLALAFVAARVSRRNVAHLRFTPGEEIVVTHSLGYPAEERVSLEGVQEFALGYEELLARFHDGHSETILRARSGADLERLRHAMEEASAHAKGDPKDEDAGK